MTHKKYLSLSFHSSWTNFTKRRSWNSIQIRITWKVMIPLAKLSENKDIIKICIFNWINRGIPSSFISLHGCITYYIEAIIDEPIINEIHKTGMEIIVEAPFKDNLLVSSSTYLFWFNGFAWHTVNKLTLHWFWSFKFFPINL